MIKKRFASTIVLALSAGFTISAFAQAKPETLLQQRQGAMYLQGKYMYSIVPMASGKIPFDANIIARNAGFLDALTQMPWDGFDPSTAEQKNTRASPDIYKDQAKFRTAQENMRAEMGRFMTTVKTGNEANIKTGIVTLNNTCNKCHDDFRIKR